VGSEWDDRIPGKRARGPLDTRGSSASKAGIRSKTSPSTKASARRWTARTPPARALRKPRSRHAGADGAGVAIPMHVPPTHLRGQSEPQNAPEDAIPLNRGPPNHGRFRLDRRISVGNLSVRMPLKMRRGCTSRVGQKRHRASVRPQYGKSDPRSCSWRKVFGSSRPRCQDPHGTRGRLVAMTLCSSSVKTAWASWLRSDPDGWPARTSLR